MRTWLGVSLLLASAALAGPRKPVVLINGPAPVVKLVSKELSKKFTPKPLGAISAMPTAREVREATGPTQAIAIVMAQPGGAFVTLQVLSGHDGTPLDTISLKMNAKKPPKALPRPQLAALVFAVAQGKAPTAKPEPPPQPEPKPEPEPLAEVKPEPEKRPEPEKKPEPPPEKKVAKKDKEPEKKKEPEPVVAAPKVEEKSEPMTPSESPAVRASLGFGGFNRGFTWQGNPSPSLATANQPFAAAVSFDAQWYPAASFTKHWLSNFGLFVSTEFGLGMASRVQESRYSNHASRARFGGLARLPIGKRFELAAHLGYSRHELTTSATAVNDDSPRPNIPNVLFNGFRGGLGVRLRLFGTVELDALGGFHTAVGKGELGSARFFPNATAFAVDAGGGLSVELAPHLRLRGGVEWQRYFVTLNAEETSTFFARSAADQYIAVAANLQWVM